MKNQIILVALAVFSIVILLSSDNIDKVFAVTLITKQWNSGSKVEDTMFYDSDRGRVLICSTDLSTTPDTREIHTFGAETLASVSNHTSAIDDNEDCETQHDNSLICLLTTDACYKSGLHAGGGAGGGSNPAGIMITSYSLVSGTTTTYTNITWTSSAQSKLIAIVGSLAYFSNSGGAMPQGIWVFNIVTAFDGISTNDAQTLSRTHSIAMPSGLNSGCYDSSSNLISVVQGNTVGKIDVSTGQFTDLGNNLGSSVSETVCFDGYAWYVSSVGGWVKKVNPSTGATSATITLAGATTVMKHGSLILIGSGSTVYGYDSTTLTQVNTFTGFTGSAVKILRKNSTAFYFMGSSERIHLYNGLPDDGSEEPAPEEGSGGNAVNGVCGNGTALDCVGSGTSPFSGITGGRNATSITQALTDGLGLTNCADDGSDVETCGSGLFTFLFLLLLTEFLALAGYLGFTRKTNSETNLMDIALFMLIIAFVDLSIAFYLNWIPDLVFYTIVVITASLLAFGLLRHVRG